MDLAVLVPVLNRPHRVKPLLDAFAATTLGARVMFIPDPDDVAEEDAIHAAGGGIVCSLAENYARKINAGVALTDEPLLFLAADDIAPQPSWLPNALAHMAGGIQVVGVNDLIERRPERARHATHFLMTREYAEQPCIDGTPGPLFTGYDHSWVDNELIDTATHRGVYAYAENSHVKHIDHPMTGGPDDDTYRKGRARFRLDRKLYQRRRHLWT